MGVANLYFGGIKMRPRNLVFAQVIFISSITSASDFGIQGRNGVNGSNGRSGEVGQSATIQATGQVLNLNLSGRDGEDGRDGRDGEDALSCIQPRRTERNLTGADGGSGGDAGRGGSGGDGGNLTIFTNDIKNLAQITVYSEGGRGGRAGRAGNFGRGCRCSEPQWKVRRCSKDSNGRDVCSETMYFCSDGRNGQLGQSRDNGLYGSRGRLTLIPTLNSLPSENRQAQVNIDSILTTKISLSAHVWQELAGALQLFAPGSTINDVYKKFMGTRQYNYSFGWTARRQPGEFLNAAIYLQATQNGVESYGSRGFWYDSSLQQNGDVYHETVLRAMNGDEAVKLDLQFEGKERALVANITDLANVSDMLKTGFTNVTFKKVRPIVWDKTLFEGTIPSSHIIENNGSFVIRLGELPGVDISDLEGGNKITLKMDVSRVFSKDYSTFQRFDSKHEIKK